MSMKTDSKPREKRSKQTMPTKTTLNLVMREKSELALSRVVPAAIIIVVLAVLFGKFAVADRYARLHKAENDLATSQVRLEELELSYADYDKVKEQYNQYTYRGFDRTIADRQEILDLLEHDIIPYSETQAVSVTGNVFSTTLTGLTLDQVSSMIARLESNPLVDGVTVSTTGYDNNSESSDSDIDSGVRPYATITIVFKSAYDDSAEGAETEGIDSNDTNAEGGAQ